MWDEQERVGYGRAGAGQVGWLAAMLSVMAIGVGVAVSGIAQQQGDPALTEVWQPEPRMVDPGSPGAAPSDAVMLFDGSNLDAWRHADGDAAWEVRDGMMTVVAGAGSLYTRQGFGDVQLHVEWRAPDIVEGDGQGRGNSGVFLMNRYEVQVLDSFDNRTYSNGQAASIYKQHIPQVNASRAPGEWQTYDILFNAAGVVESPATMTVLHNGVLVQHHVTLRGSTTFIGEPAYEPHSARQPIQLQDHSNPVSFRNIWVRELTPRQAGR